MKPFFILASASPRRRQILKANGYKFKIIPSHVKETVRPGLAPSKKVTQLALKKALWVSRQHPKHIVLGSDTLVFLGSQTIGKPTDPQDAARILRVLSGRWQKVWTGVAVVWAGGKKRLSRASLSKVKMRTLSEKEVQVYSKKHLDKAGAYSVQSRKDKFVVKIVGDYDNVVGLPMRRVRPLLARAAREALLKPV